MNVMADKYIPSMGVIKLVSVSYYHSYRVTTEYLQLVHKYN